MSTRPAAPPAGPLPRPSAREEPEFVNERDIPTEDGDPADGATRRPAPDTRTPVHPPVAGEVSVAGEEDPGASLDTGPGDDAAQDPTSRSRP